MINLGLIFCRSIYVYQAKETLNEFCRVLKDDGKVTLMVMDWDIIL